MRGGNFKITIKEGSGSNCPRLPFLCIHKQRGTYCGKGLVFKGTAGFTLVDLGTKEDSYYNSVSTKDTLSELIREFDIKPREGEIIIYE